MTDLTPTKKLAYLWAAEQTEPGLTDTRFDATNHPTPPPPIKPVLHISGLPEAVSLYGEWTLVGTANATARRDAYGESWLQMWDPLMHGAECDVATAVNNGWFTRAAA
jgi:hypothetical protein